MNKDKKTGFLIGIIAALAMVAAILGVLVLGMSMGKKDRAQSSSEETAKTAEASSAARPTVTPLPTSTPLPTAAPEPTNTPAPTNTPRPTSAPAAQSSGGYRIDSGLEVRTSQGLIFMQGDYFTLYFNTDDFNAGLWGWETTSDTTMNFYYTKARDSGLSGTVFTLIAYDWGDNGYENFPNYNIAGLTEDKKYIVTFATDLQFDADDPVQTSEYNRLKEWAMNINQNNSANPFAAG